MMSPVCTVLVPVYNEGSNIEVLLGQLKEALTFPHEIVIIYDFDEDNTLPAVKHAEEELGIQVTLLKNKYGRGVLNAMKSGLESVTTPYAIITMADLSDPPAVMNDLIAKAEADRADVVCASRYMKGGKQIGGPLLKGLMSRCAGLTLYYLGGIPSRDSTNNFKLYRKSFIDRTAIESTGGFELGIELVVKAHINSFKVAEVPTTWTDRVAGQSNFKLMKWLPKYLKWYFIALSDRLKKFSAGYGLKIALALLILFAIANGWEICRSAVNVPFSDEWYVMADMPADWSSSWIFSAHNEHRIVFTKFFMQLQYHLNHWYIPLNIYLNYVLYLGMLAWMYCLYRPSFRKYPFLALLLLPMFSLLLRDNRLWPFMNQMTFMLFWSAMAVYFGFLRRDRWLDIALFTVCLILGIYSMSFTYAAGILAVYAWVKFYFNRDNPGQWLRHLVPVLAVGGVMVFSLFNNASVTEGVTMPWQAQFWEVMFDHLGRGIPRFLVPVFVFAVLGFIGLTVLTALDPRNLKERHFQAVCALAAASILSAAAIFMKRGGIGYRHMEVILIVIPAIAVILMHIRWKWLRIPICTAFILLQLAYWPPRMYLANHYRVWQEKRLQESNDFKVYVKTRDPKYLENIIFSYKPGEHPDMDKILEKDWSFSK